MQNVQRSMILAACALGLMPATGARAAVTLALSANTDGTGSSTSVDKVSGPLTFKVNAQIVSTSTAVTDNVIGVDYKLQATGPATGVFSVVGRDVTAGGTVPAANQMSDLFNPDATITDNSSPFFYATLNPSNNYDLGSSTQFSSAGTALSSAVGKNNYPGGTGSVFHPSDIATLTLAIAPNTPNGTYTLSVLDYLGGATANSYVYADGVSLFPPSASFGTGGGNLVPSNPNGISQNFTVVVTPEPSSALLIGLGAAALGLHRRRRTPSPCL